MYTDEERHLESFFREFLEHVVGHASKPLRVVYEAAHHEGEVVMYSPGFTYEEDHQRTLTLKVVSPGFYSRFVHYAHTKEAIDRECLATDEKNSTLFVKNAGELPILLDAIQSSRMKGHSKPCILEQVRWSWLRRLRCLPPESSYHGNGGPESEYTVTDIRSFADSELDIFVKHRCSDASVYQRVVIKLFLAQRFALGVPVLVTVLDWLVRVVFIVAAMYCADHSNTIDVLRPRKILTQDVQTTAATLMTCQCYTYLEPCQRLIRYRSFVDD